MAAAAIRHASGNEGLSGIGRTAPGDSPAHSMLRVASKAHARTDESAVQRAGLIAPLHLFAGLPRGALRSIAQGGQTLHLPRGDYAFRHGETHHGFHVVVAGKVELLLPKVEDDAKVMAVLERGMSFGEAAMFLGIPSPVSARATIDTTLFYVPRETLDPVLASQPQFALQLLIRMSRRMHTLVQDIAAYPQTKAGNRIASYLIEHVRAGEPPTILLSERKQDIASRLSVAPETLSRTLRLMQENGIIRVKGYQIEVVDMKALGCLAES